MSVNVRCPSCNRKLQIKERLLGQSIHCPACETSFIAQETRNGSLREADAPTVDIPHQCDPSPPAAQRHQPEASAREGTPIPSLALRANVSGTPGTIGRFTIRSVLGQGGFGTVYRAHDPVLDREVALKTPRPGTQGAERLVLEAKAAAKLRHPNIVAVHEAGAAGDDLFIAAEYVEGETLADQLQRGPVEMTTAAHWVRSLAEALAYAHQEGIVHRDVKPHNVLIGSGGRPQLMDFGLAHDVTGEPAEGTASGAAGTPAYMSPEQARGDAASIGPASDQYSLGAVLYELLTGRAPFSSGAETVSQIAGGASPRAPREVRADIPLDLDAVCRKAIAPDPTQRYADCTEFANDLGRWLDGELVLARPHSNVERLTHWAKRHPALFGWSAAAVSVLLLLSGFGVKQIYSAMISPQPNVVAAPSDEGSNGLPENQAEDQAEPPLEAVVTTENRAAEMLLYGRLLDRTRCAFRQQDVIAADRWLGQTRWDYRNWEYNYLRRIVAGGWKTIRGHQMAVTAIAVHPDGKRFVSAALDQTVRVWDIASGDEVYAIRSDAPVMSLAFSPDGKILATATGTDPSLPTMGFGTPMQAPAPGNAAAPPPPAEASNAPRSVDTYQVELADTDDALRQDDSLIAFVDESRTVAQAPLPAQPAPAPAVEAAPAPMAAQKQPPQYVVTLRNADTGEELQVYREHAGPIASIAFSPDGRLIASGGAGASTPAPAESMPGAMSMQNGPTAGVIRLWNVETLQTEHDLESPGGPVRRLAFTSDGQRLAATAGNGPWGQVMVWNLTGTAPFGTPPGPGHGPPPAPAVPQPVLQPPAPAAPQTADTVSSPEGSPTTGPGAPSPAPILEQQFHGGYVPLALHPQSGQVVAAPAMDVWFLERMRRRVAGNTGVAHRWMPGFGDESDDLRDLSPEIRDLVFAAEPNQFGQHTLAAAGGDALLNARGVITLVDPVYEYGAQVPHLGHRSTVTAVAFRPDGKQLVSGDAAGVLKIWSAEVHPEVVALGPQRPVTRVAFGKDGRFVAIAERGRHWADVGDMGTAPMPGPMPAGAPVAMIAQDGPPVPDAEPVPPIEQPRGGVKLYDVRNRRELLSLTAGPGDVLGLAMDPGMKWVAGGGEDAMVHLWDLATGQPRFEAATPGIVRCLAVSADGNLLAAGCGGAAGGESPLNAPPLSAANGDSVVPDFVSFQPGAPAVLVDVAGQIVVWNVSDGAIVAQWQAHDDDVLSVAFSPDGKRLVSSSEDRSARLWTVADQKEVRKLDDYDGQIVDLAFRTTGEDIAGAGFDPCRPDKPGDVMIWSTADGQQRLRLENAAGWTYGVAYSPDGRRLVTGGGSFAGSLSRPGEVTVWDADTGIELLPLAGRPGRGTKSEQYMTTEKYEVEVPITIMREVVEEQTVIVKKEVDGQIVEVPEVRTRSKPVYETKVQTEFRERTVCQSQHVQWEEPGTVLGVAFSGDGRSIAAACEDGTALVWDAETCQPHDTARWASGRLVSIAASPDGKLIATGGEDGSLCGCVGLIRIYDAKTGRITRTITTTAGSVMDLAFTSDSRHLVSVGGTGAWSPPASCSAVGDMLPLTPEVYQGFFALQQNLSQAGRGEVWDVTTGERVSELTGAPLTLVHVAVHPQDDRILTLSADGKLRLWDAASGKSLKEWPENLQAIKAVAIAPDGRSFAALVRGEVAEVLLGEFDSESPLRKLPFPPGESPSAGSFDASDIAYDPKGEFLALSYVLGEGTAAKDKGGIMIWSLASPEQPPRVVTTSLPAPELQVSPDGRLLVLTQWDDSLCVIDIATGEKRLRLAGHENYADRAVFLPDGRVATIDFHRHIRVWKVAEALGRAAECEECTPPRQRTIELRGNPQAYTHRVRFSGDGKLAAVGGHNMRQTGPVIQHPVRLINANNGESHHFGGHYDVVRSVAVRPDGRQYASVGQDMNLYFWNIDGSSRPTDPHPNKLMKVVYSRDGKLVATATAFDGLAYVWDVETVRETHRFQVEPMTAFGLAFDNEGKQLVTAGLSGAVKVWNVEDGQLVREWPAHDGTIQTVVFNQAGDLLATCGHDQTVKLWKFETGELVRTLEGFAGPAWDCAFSPDDTLLAAGAHDATVRIFRIDTGEIVKELPDHGQGVWGIAFSPNGTRLACCGRESPLVVWDWQAGTRVCTNPEAGECLAWFPDGSQLVTGSVVNLPQAEPKYDSLVSLFDPHTGQLIDTITIADSARPEFDLSADGRNVVVGRQDGVAVVWDRQQHKATAECRQHQGPIHDVAFHPDGELFATAGQDATVRVWRTDGTEAFALTHPGPVACVAFDPTGSVLATGDFSQTVSLWDIDKREQLRTLPGHYGELCGLSFNGTGKYLAAVSRRGAEQGWEGDLKVWEVATGRQTLALPSHTWWEADVAFHPREPWIATTGKDHTLQMFHAETGALLLNLPTYGHLCNTMAFSPDGTQLLVQLGGTAKLIDPTPEVAPFGRALPAPPSQSTPDVQPEPVVAIPRPAEDSPVEPPASVPTDLCGLDFDGKDDSIEIEGFRYDGTYPITIEAIALPRSTGLGCVFNDYEGAGVGLYLENGRWYFSVSDNGTYRVAAGDEAADLTRASHLAGVFDGKTVSLFVNGRRQKQTGEVAGRAKPSGLPFLVGANPYPGGTIQQCFRGRIDAVRLSAGILYEVDFTPPTSFPKLDSTLILLNLEENKGDTAVDESGRGHHGKIRGAAWTRLSE